MKRFVICLFLLFFLCSAARSAVYQWSVKVSGYISEETQENPDAFLWIPPDCAQVRAIVLAQHNMCEETIFDHPNFRKTMQELGFALIWVTPGIDQQWDIRNNCQQVLDQAINDLAAISGYTELAQAPFVPLGHSAMATFPWNFAAWNPERTLAVISYHGDAPRTNLTGYGRENLEWGRNRNIDGIPGLMIQGEYEWWEARVNPALAFRMMYPESCISFLADAGHGHFDVSDQVLDYMCLFLKKAAQYRLPNAPEVDGRWKLKNLNPKQGWLAERWHPQQNRLAGAAPYAKYTGNIHDAFWYFDQEMAQETEQYYARESHKERCFIGFSFGGKLLPPKANHAQFTIDALSPSADGLYHISAIWTDSTHQVKLAGVKKAPIRLDRICGPIEKINDSTFRLQFYRMGFNNKKRTNDVWLMASAAADQEFKSAVQQINIKVNYPLREGKRQSIWFPTVDDVSSSTKTVKLHAQSDSKLTVQYYVKEGPAEIAGDKLVLTAIPPKAKYPIKVTVVAWQYGVPEKMQSAEPVERYFYINR